MSKIDSTNWFGEIEQQTDELVDSLKKQAQGKTSYAANDRLDRNELISIKALIAYLSHTQKLSSNSLHRLLEMKFNVGAFEEIKRGDFQQAVEFLVDLQDSGSLN